MLPRIAARNYVFQSNTERSRLTSGWGLRECEVGTMVLSGYYNHLNELEFQMLSGICQESIGMAQGDGYIER